MLAFLNSLPSEANASWTLVEIGAILLALGALAIVARRLAVSVVPLYLLLGLSLGQGGLLPLNLSATFLNTGAQFGAILLLLMLGLEYSGQELAKSYSERKSIGLIDLLVNALPGAAFGLLLGWGATGAVAMAGITFVSSSGIASQMIKESGWARSELAKRVSSVLIVEDLTLAPYLPLVSALVAGVSALAGLLSVGIALVVTFLALAISFRGENGIGRFLSRQTPAALLLAVLGAALLFAGFAELASFSSAVAAFLVGLLLTGEVAQSVRARLAPLRDIFAAVFFIFFGLSITPVEVLSQLPLALVLAVFGIAGKVLVARVASRGLSDEQSWRRASAFLIPRGEFSILIAALAGSTVFGSDIRALTMGYVLITSIVASILLRTSRSKFSS